MIGIDKVLIRFSGSARQEPTGRKLQLKARARSGTERRGESRVLPEGGGGSNQRFNMVLVRLQYGLNKV